MPRVQSIADQIFAIAHILRLAGSGCAGQIIRPSRVQITDSGIERGMDGLDRLITVGGAPLDGERHRAHAEAGNLIAGKCCRGRALVRAVRSRFAHSSHLISLAGQSERFRLG